ncbi:hypothetical protein KFL_001890060 [Klebsormidium nitens]|uniref:Uncharacterized protein n=1 Tax=Klebsormidium nitens TaxID=105231 RepID=A0A1Y1I3A9_KLENI|nr:hypothetical protein KFL_001890060 [Klebsormidium nitens]|eukprot:GAQ84442.1 hypothetical protein KFL_001890060 [Klebsormidium nitens]
MTLGEQQIVLDPYGAVQDSDSESDRESGPSDAGIKLTRRKKVDPSKAEPQSKVQSYQAQVRKRGGENGVAGKSREGATEGASPEGNNERKEKKGKNRRSRVGQSFQQANGAVRAVKSTSEGMVSESVTKLTEVLENVVGEGRIGGVPVARIIAKGLSGAVKGGAAASMAESVGMHVGGGQIEIAAFRGALTGAVADVVSLFIDPPAQEIGEDAVERGEQAAEELEARLRAKSGGTVIIKREKTTDGRMGKILGTEKKKEAGRKTKKEKKEGEEKKEKEKKSDSASGSEGSVNVHSDATASEGVKEEGMVWGQMEERQSTTAVSVVGNAVDLGTKALSGAMKGAIWGAAQEASKSGFIPHGAVKGAISGAFGDTIASRVDPLAQKSQELINGREKKQEEDKPKGTIRRKVEGAKEIAETQVLREGEGGPEIEEKGGVETGGESNKGEGEKRKEDEVVEVNATRGGREVRVRSGARLQVVAKKYKTVGEGGKTEEVPFPTAESVLEGSERPVKVGADLEVAARRGDVAADDEEEDETLAAVDASFQAGLEAVGDDVIPQGLSGSADVDERADGDEEKSGKSAKEPGDSEPGTQKVKEEGRKVTGAQLARPQSKSVDGLRVKRGHWSSDLVFETGFGGSDVVIENPQLAERIEAEEGVGLEIEGAVDNPVSEQLCLLKEKGVQMRKQEKGFWTEEQQAEAEKTALRKLTRALGGAVKGAATGAMTEMATTGTISGIGAVKGAVGGAVADLAADVADPIAEQVGKDSDSDSEEEADADADVDADVESDVEVEVEADATGERLEVTASATATQRERLEKGAD